jgi:ribonuclease BN (tRNA processing enzyme)
MLPELGVVLDAGTGMYRVRNWLRTPALDIFLTHAHLDHVVGLTFLFDVLYQKSVERVTVHGEADKLAAIQKHLFAPPLFPAQPPITWQPLNGPVTLGDGGRLTYFPLEHPGGAIGFRLDWPGKSLAYVTDTTAKPSASYLERITGVDLLVHECYFTDERDAWAEKTGHSCLTAVAQLAAAAQVGRMVLVHVNPLDADQPSGAEEALDLTAARRIFAAMELGADRQVIEF